jgi:hypothetical protein
MKGINFSYVLTAEQVEQVGQDEHTEHTEQAEETEQGEQISENDKYPEETRNENAAKFNQLGDSEDSHFYAYFMTMVVICIIGYLVFHNKQKVCNLVRCILAYPCSGSKLDVFMSKERTVKKE